MSLLLSRVRRIHLMLLLDWLLLLILRSSKGIEEGINLVVEWMGAKDRRCGGDEMALHLLGLLVMVLDLKLKRTKC